MPFSSIRYRLLPVGVAVLMPVLAGMGDCTSESYSTYFQVRNALIEELKKETHVPSNFVLRPPPPLSAATAWGLGSVFIVERANGKDVLIDGVRFADTCGPAASAVEDTELQALPSWSQSRKFELSVELPALLGLAKQLEPSVGASFVPKKILQFSYEPPRRVRTANLDKLLEGFNTPECLADIANRPVFILASVYTMREVFKSQKSLSTGAHASFKAFSDASLKIQYDSEGNVQVEDDRPYPRLWMLARKEVSIPGLDPTYPRARRVAIANAWTGAEQSVLARFRDHTVDAGIIDRLKATDPSRR